MRMRGAVLSVCLLVAGIHTARGQLITVVNEDFESGLGAWTARVGTPWPAEQNGTPVLFSPTDPLLYTNTGNPGSQSAGFSSNLSPWDNSLAAWMEKRFVGVLPAGTYRVRLELDRYVYKDPAYRAPVAPDPYAIGNRVFLFTDSCYANPCLNFDGGMPAGGIRKSYWPGDPTTDPKAANGTWQHIVLIDQDVTTTTGNFELRLLMHEKYPGAEAVAWDNINLTIGTFTFTEDFESGLDGWTVRSYEANHPHDDTPAVFTPTDSGLFANAGNPGSASAGFTSDLSCYDNTRTAWLSRLMPELLPPGTYAVAIEFDAYVYKDPTQSPDDPEALGNRVLLLTDDAYDNPSYVLDTEIPLPGFAIDLWRGDSKGEVNGVWQHVSLYHDVTTATGNFELRLLVQDKIDVVASTNLPEPSLWANSSGRMAVAWDNVQVQIGPPCYSPRFDADNDGDVDQNDFSAYQLCYTGPVKDIVDFPHCRCMDANGDGHVDAGDLAAFSKCASGPMVPADPTCDDDLP